MFSKATNNQKEQKAMLCAHEFFKKYKAHCNLFQEAKGERKLLRNDMRVFFSTDKKNWDFFVVVETRERDQAWKPFYFPIYEEAVLRVEENNQESKISFCFNLNEEVETRVRIEFMIFNENFDAASKFMNIFTRLLWQTKHKKLYSEAGRGFNFDSLCHVVGADDVGSNIEGAILELFENLKEEKGIQFLGIGDLYSAGEGDHLNQVAGKYLFALRNTKQFEFQFEIYDQDGKILYHKQVDKDLYYIINEDMNDISWTDSKANQVASFVFRFKDNSAAANLAVNMTIDILTSNKKMEIEEIFQSKDNKDWDQFYGHCTSDIIDNDDEESGDYDEYYEDEPLPLKFGTESTFISQEEKDFTNMVSAKTIDRCFGIKGDIITSYASENGDEIERIGNLPLLKKLNGDSFQPGECLITDLDRKMLMLEKGNSDSVFLLDMEKGKIVQEIQGSGNGAIKDISLGTKLDFLEPSSVFYGVEGQNIFQMDPRASNAIVNQRPYKTDYMFAKIATSSDGQFAVGSENGQIRMYNQVGGNAKNLIPSFNGEPILDLDASKDGKFLLATTPSTVMLIKTVQDGKSGFDYMFRKSAKPTPISLKIHANSLAKHGIRKPVFRGAKFNQSEKREAYIVAHTEFHIIIWSMRKLRSRNYATTAIKRYDETIIQKDFKFNQHSIIAALPRNLKYENTIVPSKL